MELDKALEYALILAWDDLVKVANPSSARVEYQCEPGTPLDYLSVWSVRAGGVQDLVCDYWAWASSAYPTGVSFRNRFHSDQLSQALGFIMVNQDQFARRADECHNGLAQIYPPTEDERAKAATWMKGVHGVVTNLSRAGDEQVATL